MGVGRSCNPARLRATLDQVGLGATEDQEGAWLPFRHVSTADINATVVKAAAGRIGTLVLSNGDSTVIAFVKIFDQATAPDPSASTANLKWTIPLMPLDTIILDFGSGAGFENGISFVITAGPTDNDETAISANDVFINGTYI